MNLTEEILTVAAEAECLYEAHAISEAITRMAGEIEQRLSATHPVILSVLNGGLFFTAELVLKLPFPLELESIKAGRYQGATRGDSMRWQLLPGVPLQDRTVLIVDDILDEGITLDEIRRYCLDAGAREVLTAVLVDKQIGREKPCQADFVGLETEDRYLFGYGLDYKNHLRNWPGIYACSSTASTGVTE